MPSGRIRGEVFDDALSLPLLSVRAYRRAAILLRFLGRLGVGDYERLGRCHLVALSVKPRTTTKVKAHS